MQCERTLNAYDFRDIQTRPPNSHVRFTASRAEDLRHALRHQAEPWQQRANQIQGQDDLPRRVPPIRRLPRVLTAHERRKAQGMQSFCYFVGRVSIYTERKPK